jgi:hypothetical protein
VSNFAPKLQDSTDDQLWHLINESSPHFSVLASDELTRRSLVKLQKNIDKFNKTSTKQTEKMIVLTRWIVGLTIAMLVGLGIQIFLSMA